MSINIYFCQNTMGTSQSSEFDRQIHDESLWEAVLKEDFEKRTLLLEHLRMLDEQAIQCCWGLCKRKLITQPSVSSYGLIYDKQLMMYFGEIKGKEGDGEGILYENNKLIFKGSVKNTQRHGHGVLYKSKEKLVESSEWKNNRLIQITLHNGNRIKILGQKNQTCWRVAWTTVNGSYEGEATYEGDKLVRNGQGKWQTATYKYEGKWKNNLPEGKGLSSYQNKDNYYGWFKGGKKHGNGMYTLYDGRKIEGYWQFDIFLQGKQYSAEGSLISSYPTAAQS